MTTTPNSAQAGGEPSSETNRIAVEKWLNKQGYPLEYRTYVALWKRFFGESGLGMYVQSKEGDPREIDVYAQMTLWDKDVFFFLRVIIECKYSRDKPWVLLYGNSDKTGLLDTWFRTPRSNSLREPRSTKEGFSQELADKLSKAFHFSNGLALAHNIVQAHTKAGDGGRDHAYDSLRKICDAAWDSVETGQLVQTRLYAMIFPCLVVDGPLFAASYDPQAERVQAKEIKYGRVCWRGAFHGTYVDVVQAEALDQYAERAKESLSTIMEVLRAIYEDAPRGVFL